MNLRDQHGYAMAALLVAMSILAVLMTVAMPTWRQITQREKEAELIFRGQQYARAIGLFQRKAGPGVLPPSVDLLIEQRFLRKQYKDPITGGDFELLTPTTAPVAPAGNDPRTSGGRGGSAPTPTPTTTVERLTSPTSATGNVGGRGGLVGVASKSKAESIRIYNGRSHYNEWQFVFVAQTNAPGATPDTANPGQDPGRGGRGGTSFPARQGFESGPSPFGTGGGRSGMPPPGGRSSMPPPGGRSSMPPPGGGSGSPFQPLQGGGASGPQPPPSRR
jgi:type II secretory pathway pseudopilin PulG